MWHNEHPDIVEMIVKEFHRIRNPYVKRPNEKDNRVLTVARLDQEILKHSSNYQYSKHLDQMAYKVFSIKIVVTF